MENLHRHIIYLLSRRDCVIVPGVGAFIAERRPAAYNPTTGRWVPPTRHISFNAAVRSDDGLLSHSFSRAMGVDFEHGRHELTLAVSDLLQTIRDNGRCTIGTLGTLTANDEGRLSFTPAVTPGRRSGQLGYHAFSMPQLPIQVSHSADEADTVSTDNEAADDTVDVVVRRAPRLRRIRRQLAVACSLAAIIICGVLLYNIPGPATQLASVFPVPAAKTVHQKPSASTPAPGIALPAETPTSRTGTLAQATDSVNKTSEAMIQVSGAVAQTSEGDAQAKETDAKTSETKYHLIVATFATESEAQKYIAQSHSSESRSLYTVRGTRVTRVAIAGSDSRDALLATLRTPEMRAAHPNAWIWSAD